MAGLLTSSTAAAQQAKAISDAISTEMRMHSVSMIAAAEAVPAEKYSWQPSAQQVSFGQLFFHSADANYTLCSAIGDGRKPDVPVKATGPKDNLVQQLKDSFAYCSRAFEKIDPAALDKAIQLYGRSVTGWWVLFHMALDWGDHYSQAAMMLRMNGITPPSAQRRGN
jgi:uncharacterized damage-inducible protein DinB